MLAISIDRFRRVCFPFSKQFTVASVRYLVIGLALFSLLIAARDVVATDVVRNNITIVVNSTKGFYCTYSDNSVFQAVEGVFHFVDICLHAIIIFCLILLYSFVVRNIVQSKRNLKMHTSGITKACRRNNEVASQSHGANIDIVKCQLSESHVDDRKASESATKFDINNYPEQMERTEKLSILTKYNKTISNTFRKNNSENKPHKHERRVSEMRITIMVAVITLASILCFVPYYLSILLVSSNMSGDGLIMSVENILLRRSYMLNSAINPVVMICFNKAFRSFIKSFPRCQCMK